MEGGGTLVTVSVAVPLIPFSAAVISNAPAVFPVASPPLVIVATDGLPEDQLTWLVRSAVLLFEYVPVALNCCVAPTPIDGLAGVTTNDTKTGSKLPSEKLAGVDTPAAVAVTV